MTYTIEMVGCETEDGMIIEIESHGTVVCPGCGKVVANRNGKGVVAKHFTVIESRKQECHSSQLRHVGEVVTPPTFKLVSPAPVGPKTTYIINGKFIRAYTYAEAVAYANR